MLKTSREMKVKELNEQLREANRSISQLQKTITSLKAAADQYALDAEKRSKLDDIKNLFPKSNALKRAANEKETIIKGFQQKKRILLQKKEEL